MFYLRTLGGLSLELDDQPVVALAGNRKPLILLAILAVEGTVARDRLLALLWPESDSERARGALRQTLHLIRHALANGDVVTGTTDLRLNPQCIDSDVDHFMRAARARDAETAAGLYGGPFLDGVHISDAHEFELWLDERRATLQQQYAAALEQLAERAETREDFAAAIAWWRKRQAVDPADGVVAARLIRALDAAGQRAAALRHAELHQSILQQEFELPPDPAVAALADEVRTRQSPIHRKTLERFAAQIPGLRSRRHPVMALFAAAALAFLILSAGMVAAFRLSRDKPRTIAATPESQNKARALEYLLKGEQLLQQKTAQGTREAKAYFTRAIELDSTLIDAYVALANTELAPSLTDPKPRLARAKQWAERALAMDSTSAAAHTVMLWVTTLYDRDFPAAERHFRRAYELDPAYPALHNAYTVYLITRGRSQQALRALLHAYELRPDATPTMAYVALHYLMLGERADAQRYLDEALARDTTFFMTRWVSGRLHLESAEYDAALRDFARPGTDLGGIGQQAFVGYTLGRAGRTAEARALLERVLAQRERGGYVAPTDLAIIHIGLGEHERALDWLEQLVEHRGIRIFLKADPIFEPVRTHPRFQRLLADLNLAG